jgi:hypothetical protein
LRRLSIEALEERTVPSTVSWINPASGDWDAPSNWSTGLVPGPSDDVVINVAGITVTHSLANAESIHSLTSAANVDWQNGSLTLASNSSVSGTFANAGAVTIQAGLLALDGGGTDSGSFSVAAGADLRFGGAATLGPGSQVSGDGGVAFDGGSASVQGTYNLGPDGATQVGDAPVDFSGTVLGVGGSLDIHGGDFGLAASADFHGTALTLADLSLSGVGNVSPLTSTSLRAGGVTINHQFTWGSGTLSGPGTTTIAAGATLVLSHNAGAGGTFWDLDGRVLNNYGTAQFFAAPFDETLLLSGGSVFNNYGSFQGANGRTVVVSGSGTGEVFNNYGTIAQAGSQQMAFELPVNNSGTVNVPTGLLAMDGGGNDSGSIVGAAGASVRLGGTMTLAPPVLGQASTSVDTLAWSGATLNYQIAGPNPGTGFNQITVTSPLSLGIPFNLSLAQGFTPTLAETFTIIENQSSSPIGGTFSGLPEAAVIADAAGDQFRISYAGGDGNDVTLTTIFAHKTDTSTVVTPSANPALLNQAVTFTATVAPAISSAGVPTGSVQFVIDGNNFGSAVVLTNGSASATTSSLTVGPHTIQAVYSGDAHFFASSSTITESVQYNFSGFLTPVSLNRAFKQGSSIPIKWRLADANGNLITSLSAVQSLAVTIGSTTYTLYNGSTNTSSYTTGGTVFRNDGSQYVFNWSTKSFPTGTYTLTATFNDGTTQTKAVVLSTTGSTLSLVIDGTLANSPTAGALLAGDLTLYVDNSNGAFTSDEQARIQEAVAGIETLISSYGANVFVVDSSIGDAANIVLEMSTTSALGGQANGVLGCTTDSGLVTIVDGWNWYAGANATTIGSGQYDFQTVVTHEIGHALGLGHSSTSVSVMYPSLGTSEIRRTMVTADLNIPDTGTGPGGLHAIQVAPGNADIFLTAALGTNQTPSGSALTPPPQTQIEGGVAAERDALWRSLQEMFRDVPDDQLSAKVFRAAPFVREGSIQTDSFAALDALMSEWGRAVQDSRNELVGR